MEFYSHYPIIDNTTGIVPEMDVELVEGNILQFAPNDNPDRPTLIDQLDTPAPDLFLEFARIRREADRLWEKDLKRGVKDGDSKDWQKIYDDCLIEFARKHGPLFGFSGLSDTAPVIREPLKCWHDAQLVMDTTLLLNVFVEGGDVDIEEVRDLFPVTATMTPDLDLWEYRYVPGITPDGLYLDSLRDDFTKWYTTEDETMIGAVWCRSEEDFGLNASFVTRYGGMNTGATAHTGMPVSVPLEQALSHQEIREEMPSLLKVVAEAHCKGMRLGFRNLYSVAGKNEGGYQVLSDSMLAFMWNELALTYSRRAFKRCANPRCDNIIAENLTTGTAREFCSDACRAQVNNAKLTQQCKRGRDSFYAANDLATIYRDAFDEDVRWDDPDCIAKMKRLKRWIDKDYAVTKKGKIALTKGAARMPSRTLEK